MGKTVYGDVAVVRSRPTDSDQYPDRSSPRGKRADLEGQWGFPRDFLTEFHLVISRFELLIELDSMPSEKQKTDGLGP
jgi:hypothetical protein